MSDYLGVTGAMAVVLPFDLHVKKMKWMLDHVNGLVLSSEDAVLVDSHGSFTDYMKTVKFAIEYAQKRNSDGDFFPVLGIGNGMEALLVALGGSGSVMHCGGTLEASVHSMELSADFSGS